MNVSIIGAGTMGNGIAHVFAQHGHSVTLIDLDQERLDAALATIDKNLGRQVKKEMLTVAEQEEALARITLGTSISDGVVEADLVVEAATENPEIKAQIFRSMDEDAPEEAILATNTSSISITQIAAETGRADQVVGMHFFNPVPVMKLVEVVRGLQTSDETVQRTVALAKAVGKTPVSCNDHPGFVSNRVLMPMINEAIFALQEGVAQAEAIDEIMKLGMNHPMGPLALADLIGLDVCLDIMTVLHRDLGEDKYRPCPLLRKQVQAGRLGRKSGRGFHGYE